MKQQKTKKQKKMKRRNQLKRSRIRNRRRKGQKKKQKRSRKRNKKWNRSSNETIFVYTKDIAILADIYRSRTDTRSWFSKSCNCIIPKGSWCKDRLNVKEPGQLVSVACQPSSHCPCVLWMPNILISKQLLAKYSTKIIHDIFIRDKQSSIGT